MKVIAVTGRSGEGKTTLIEKVAKELSARGFSVTYIKHSHHDFSFAPEGKDTSRILGSGAMRAIFCGERITVDISKKGRSLGDVLNAVDRGDVVLVEGFGNEDIPAIEVTGSGDDSLLRGKNIVALVSRSRVGTHIPVFSPEDIDGIVKFILGMPDGRDDDHGQGGTDDSV
ncbi:MAG: molybdopterin-guanine dinucleotide biosynthesis protein B [Deltaproteobacteria bacterium]|nr:molybdopterin-guanine dinucleotide biosynthesis protein B [Deltaproteobacteria bacterium]NIS78070.1 molybdopterin-guanine dinucleotide biosynthesis protein B [Deltaproteobacteria bacterium]